LRERGHEIRAVCLRGHDGQQRRMWHRIRDYVDDVDRAAAKVQAHETDPEDDPRRPWTLESIAVCLRD
jgi:hypothetical protein